MCCYSVVPLIRLIAAAQGAPLPSLSGGFKLLLEAEPQPTRLCHTNHCQEPHLTGAGKYCDSSRLQELVSGGVFNHLKSANHKLEVLVTNTCVINVSFHVNGSCAGPTLVLCHTAGSRPNKFKINLLTKISYFYLVLLILSLRQYLPIQSDRS